MTIRTIWRTWPATTATIITTLAHMMVLFAFAARGWPGENRGCYDKYRTQEDCYCERPRGSQPGDVWFAQPSNTWSNMAFVFAGLLCAWCSDTRKIPFSSCCNNNWWSHHDNFMTGLNLSNQGAMENIATTSSHVNKTIFHPNIIPISYCCVVAFLGPGSMFMHASLTYWGGTVDVLSMIFYTGWICMYVIGKFWFPSLDVMNKIFISYLVVMIILAIAAAIPVGDRDNKNGLIVGLYIIVIFISVGFELFQRLWFRCCRNNNHSDHGTTRRTADVWILVMGLVTYAIASVVWSMSLSGGNRCFPNSWIQGHAVWHILSGVTTVWVFFYSLSERSIVSSPSIEDHHDNNIKDCDVA